MKVFISWSGERSKVIAEALDWLLPRCINTINTWVSSEGIEPGARWSADIAKQLEETDFGIICLTKDNLNSKWIHFEAGALSKLVDNSLVVPYLFENKPTDIVGPLAQFNSENVDKDGTIKILRKLLELSIQNNELDIQLSILEDAVKKYWEDFEKMIEKIPNQISSSIEQRSNSEMFEEIISLLRSQTRTTEQSRDRFEFKIIDRFWREMDIMFKVRPVSATDFLRPDKFIRMRWFKDLREAIDIKQIQLTEAFMSQAIKQYASYLKGPIQEELPPV